ncbi:MAG: tetratricopeptide repeat protein [Cyclobacteriaceae bacterium]|nr:tetratricopeptide repeat protein [Cyclobacteriaceae bacterium]
MKTNKENIDLIEKYLDDNLDPEELKLFNQKLNRDPEFHRLYFEMDRLVEGIRISARKTTLEEKLANLERTLPFQKSENRKSGTPVVILMERMMQYKVAIAAVITLLFVATFVLTTRDFGTDPGKLYAQYFEPLENFESRTKRSIENSDAELSQRAFQYYDQGDYQNALDIFKSLQNETLDKTIDPVSRWLYMGNAYMALGDTENAIPLFQQVIEANTGFVVNAKWYLALCYLKQENLQEAKKLLTELETQGRHKHDEAVKILEKLN